MKTNLINKIRGIRAFATLVKDPARLDQVLELGKDMATPERLGILRDRYLKTETGARAVLERTQIGTVDMTTLAALPAGTLGHEFAKFMKERNLKREDLVMPEIETDLDYVRVHLLDTHDLWHLVAGFDTDVAGELGLQAFGAVHIGSYFSYLIIAGALLNAVFYDFADAPRRMAEITRGWTVGTEAKSFLGIDWKQKWAEPLTEIQRDLGVVVKQADGAQAPLLVNATELAGPKEI